VLGSIGFLSDAKLSDFAPTYRPTSSDLRLATSMLVRGPIVDHPAVATTAHLARLFAAQITKRQGTTNRNDNQG
jgi:hypothetical protein